MFPHIIRGVHGWARLNPVSARPALGRTWALKSSQINKRAELDLSGKKFEGLAWRGPAWPAMKKPASKESSGRPLVSFEKNNYKESS